MLLSKAVKEAGYKVVLTGEGADEVFGGYPIYRYMDYVDRFRALPGFIKSPVQKLMTGMGGKFR